MLSETRILPLSDQDVLICVSTRPHRHKLGVFTSTTSASMESFSPRSTFNLPFVLYKAIFRPAFDLPPQQPSSTTTFFTTTLSGNNTEGNCAATVLLLDRVPAGSKDCLTNTPSSRMRRWVASHFRLWTTRSTNFTLLLLLPRTPFDLQP